MSTVWQTYQSMTRDRSVAGQKVARGTVRRIFGYARQYRLIIALFLGTLIVTSLLSVAQPLLFKRIIDDGISVGNASLVTWTALAIAGLAIAYAAFGIVGRWYSARIGEGLIFDLRSQVYDHVQHQSIAFFTRAQTGALISRLNSDVIGAQQAFTSTLGGVLGNLISVSVVLIAMFTLSWQITLASLILVPLFLLPARYMGRRLQALTREQMALNAEMSSRMTERFNVSGALLVKLYGRPEDESTLFAGRARRVRDIGIRIAMANRWFFTALSLVAALATAVTYGLGGNLVIDGAITLGTLLALVGLLAQLYSPLTALSNVRVDIMTALVSFERVFEVLDLDPLVREPAEPRTLPSGALDVEFHSVSFTYPSGPEVSLASLESVAREQSLDSNEPVLHDVSFTVAAGSLTALEGPSGAGKSTIPSLVARLYDPNDGMVRLGGVDVRKVARNDLRWAIGVVSQDAHLFHDTIGANLRYAQPDASTDEVLQACEDAQIMNLIEQLPDGLDTVVGDRGYRLSGGEKQRLALARLFLKAPRVVVLDEATAHLDSENERLVQRALDSAPEGRTSVVIAHRLSTIRRADQILVVDQGRIIQRGTHSELLAAGGIYETLYRTQFSDA